MYLSTYQYDKSKKKLKLLENIVLFNAIPAMDWHTEITIAVEK